MDKIKTKLKFIKSDRTESWVGFVSINTKTGYIKGVREDAKGPKKVCIVTHELEPIIEPNVLYDVQMVPMKNEKEEGLIQMVADFAAVVKQAGEDYSPSIIANYTYDLVKEYNQFYHDYSILREENEAVKVFRIALSANVAKVVRLGMNLLGIEVPSRM